MESFSARQGVLKRRIHASMKKEVYNVTQAKVYRKLLLNFVYYNFFFRYTLTKTMRLNQASASV